MPFRGRSIRSLDDKGRIMMPPEFRDIVVARCAEGKFMCTTYDGCLVGFPLPDWEEFEYKISRIKNSSRKLRDFRRLVIGGAEELSVDKQGRVRLSQAHRDYAGLDGEAEIVGQLEKFEIWNPQRLSGATEQDFSDVAEELAASGIDVPL
ncbi:MAG: division/cell wall cluster transcriptional repressor MraZ [Oceanidesulfovibrio sp.]